MNTETYRLIAGQCLFPALSPSHIRICIPHVKAGPIISIIKRKRTRWSILPLSLQYTAPLVEDQGDEVDGGGNADDAAGDLPEDSFGRCSVERDRDVHAKDARDRDGAAHHQGGRGQQDPHLQQLVLLVVQHDVDVVLRVVHVLAQLQNNNQQAAKACDPAMVSSGWQERSQEMDDGIDQRHS